MEYWGAPGRFRDPRKDIRDTYMTKWCPKRQWGSLGGAVQGIPHWGVGLP